jgi:carboxypeptidase C (cathepsin A)
MKKLLITVAVVLFTVRGPAARASDGPSGGVNDRAKNNAAEAPKAEQALTQHRIVIGGTTINYTATAGTLIVRNEKDEPYASIGYFAYVQKDVSDPNRRPITFAYNGGPGSSSIWLHVGALGPRRVVTADAAVTPPPPYTVVDNVFSILDRTDLVMIDPVGTGYSKAVGEAKDADFWSVDADIASVSRFIKQYITENGRWNSPKFLLGESYGTTRSAGVVDYLQTNESMAFNGLILVSMATDLNAILDSLLEGARYEQLSFPLYLPSYAAVAWYHKALPDRPAELAPFLDEVRAFALGDYEHALTLGNNLPGTERQAIIERLHRYTGLSSEYLDRADLRVGVVQFAKELLRDRRAMVGILDGRFLGASLNPLGEKAELDAMDSAMVPAYVAAFLDYVHRDLAFDQGRTYAVQAEVYKIWDFRHKIEGSELPQPMVNTGVDLAHAMSCNPSLRVLVLQGIFDLGSPLLASEYMVSHLELPREFRSHIAIEYYNAGHMMYLHEPSLQKFKNDVGTFVEGICDR